MTFQIGIVGTDGVLLASDKRLMDLRRYPQDDIEKIHFNKTRDIAYCCCGDDTTDRSARDYLESGLRDIANNLSGFRDEAIRHAHLTQKGVYGGVILLAQKTGDHVDLWRIGVEDSDPPTLFPYPQRIPLFELAGDFRNPATFIVSRYLPREKLPLSKLKVIASHAVMNAEALNPTSIQGLEIALCYPSGFEKIPDKEIKEIKQRSRDIDQMTERSLFD